MKKIAFAALLMLVALIFGAQTAAAAPPGSPVTDLVAVPTDPPNPKPCKLKPVSCDDPSLKAWPDLPPDTTEPSEPPTTTTAQAPPTTTEPVGHSRESGPRHESAGDPKAAGNSAPVAETSAGPNSTWWPIAVLVLAVLGLVVVGTLRWIHRTERRPQQ